MKSTEARSKNHRVEAPKMRRGKRVLDHVRMTPAANGGHIMEVHTRPANEREPGGYEPPTQHVFENVDDMHKAHKAMLNDHDGDEGGNQAEARESNQSGEEELPE